jgi:hypothetical protein
MFPSRNETHCDWTEGFGSLVPQLSAYNIGFLMGWCEIPLEGS